MVWKSEFRNSEFLLYIAHPESFRCNAQIAIAFARRNRPRIHRNDEFACIYLRSRAFAFAFVCEYILFAIDRVRVRTYVRDRGDVYTRICKYP